MSKQGGSEPPRVPMVWTVIGTDIELNRVDGPLVFEGEGVEVVEAQPVKEAIGRLKDTAEWLVRCYRSLLPC